MAAPGVISIQGMAPTQAGKAAVVAVRRQPFAPRFDSEGGQVGIRNEVPSCAGLPAQAGEDLPVSIARPDRDAMRLGSHLLRERERGAERARRVEDARMRDDPYEAAQDEVRQAVG